MIGLVLVLVFAIVALSGALFLLGFRLGGGHWKGELSRVRMEAVHAEHQLHELTRQAFTTMAEESQRRRRPPDTGEGNRLDPRR
jgi:hypothetical protein